MLTKGNGCFSASGCPHFHNIGQEDSGTTLASSGWLGSIVVGHQTSDRKTASSTPGRCIAGYGG